MTRPDTNDFDFDLHQLVGIRVLNASPTDIAAVRRQLGPLESPLHREPDILIRFVDRLPRPTSLRYLGADEAGYTDEAFWILRGKHKSQAKVMIPIEQVGSRCEIVCETGVAAVPLLIAIINLTALHKGALPLHASAFTYNGIGALATGWSKGGKTETLLAFMANGARYIADEWVYLHGDGKISGIPEPIRVWDWHLKDLPQYRACAPRSGLLRLRAIKWMQLALRCIPDGSWQLGRIKDRLAPFLKRQSFVDVAAAKLFGREQMQLVGELDRVFFVVSQARPGIIVEPMDTVEIARRMVHSLQYEQSPFLGYYRMFRFAFPDRVNEVVERTEERQGELLRSAIANKPAFAVYHPYPVSLRSLFEMMAPYCQRSSALLKQLPDFAAANGAHQP